jgi:hypothetical protein
MSITAFGGVNRRNHVVHLNQLEVPHLADCFTTHHRMTSALVDWVATHTNDKGSPTVAGFDGPSWAPALHLDFDAETDPALALTWVRQVLLRLQAEGVNLRAVRVYFSGHKGFHSELPASLFGGFTPSVHLADQLKQAAIAILQDIPFDHSVYDKLRLWRLPNTRHGVSGLFKIPLTVTELFTLDLAAIQELARAPRGPADHPELTPIPDEEWEPVPALVAIWTNCAASMKETTSGETRQKIRGEVTDPARDAHTIAAICAAWPREPGVSRHSDLLLPTAGFLTLHTDPEHVKDLLRRAAEQSGDRDFLAETRGWQAEIDRMVEHSIQRQAQDRPWAGRPTLATRFPLLADVLETLWPNPQLVVGGGDRELAPAPFPLEALPEPYREFVTQAAASVVAPVDYVALALLVTAGTLIGNAWEIELKADWREGPNLYAAVVGSPGTKKTPGMAPGLHPIQEIQTRLNRAYGEALAQYELDLAAWESRPKEERGTKPTPPRYGHVLTTDSTAEALVPLLASSKGIVMLRDELVGWVKAMDQYRGGKGADRQNFLTAWSRGLMKVDRKGNATQGSAPLYVPLPCLSVLGGIQPDLLPELSDAAQREDGFLDRLLFAWPASSADHWSEITIDPTLREAVQHAFDQLADLDPMVTPDGGLGPRPIPLSADAKVAFVEWYEEHAARMASSTFPDFLRGPWAKFPSQFARLALILHGLRAVVEPLPNMVDERTICMAATLVEDYFKPHTERVWRKVRGATPAIGPRLIRYLMEHGGRVKQSELYTEALGNNVPIEVMLTELRRYQQEGVLDCEVSRDPDQAVGRSPVWWFLRSYVSSGTTFLAEVPHE